VPPLVVASKVTVLVEVPLLLVAVAVVIEPLVTEGVYCAYKVAAAFAV
jgi:hypothetical protein